MAMSTRASASHSSTCPLAGKLGARAAEQPAHQRHADRRQGAERHASARRLRLAADLVFQALGVGQQRLHLRKQARARLGELDAAAGAVEEAGAALALQRVELAAEQRLVAVQEKRSAGEAAEFADGDEGPPLVQVGRDVDLEI
jgi:hypothetical protein